MKILEKTLACAILLSLILKFSLVSGGDTLMLWTITILACIYYPLGFLFFNQIRLRNVFKKDSYKHLSAPKIIFAIVTGIGLSIICIGSLFKLLDFPGANQMLTIGLFVSFVVLIISLVFFIKTRDADNKFILWRVIVLGIAGIILIQTPGLSIIKLQYRNHPAYIEAYINHKADPRSEELRKKKEKEYHRIVLTEEQFNKYYQSPGE
jgi:hypothetical protein